MAATSNTTNTQNSVYVGDHTFNDHLEPLPTVIGPRLLVRRDTSPEVSEGGIHLPEQVRENLSEGEVIAIGTKCEYEFEEGQRVVFSPYAGDSVKIEGEDFLVVREDVILLAF